MKHVIISLGMGTLLFASNFSDGVKAYNSGDFTTAQKLLDLALNEDGALQANYLLGMIYLRSGKTSTAKSYLAEAERAGNAKAKCALASLYLGERKNDPEKIRRLLSDGYRQGAKECLQVAEQNKIALPN